MKHGYADRQIFSCSNSIELTMISLTKNWLRIILNFSLIKLFSLICSLKKIWRRLNFIMKILKNWRMNWSSLKKSKANTVRLSLNKLALKIVKWVKWLKFFKLVRICFNPVLNLRISSQIIKIKFIMMLSIYLTHNN